jgi:hypothetical protein
MIQRIQSFYLLVIFILSLVTLFSPMAGLHNVETSALYELNYRGLFSVEAGSQSLQTSVWMLTAILVLVPVISLISIFLFKKRLIQIRMTIFNIVLSAGFYGMLFIYLWQFGKSLDAKFFVELVAAFPLVNIILGVLTVRAIGKDEALVRSLDRIR